MENCTLIADSGSTKTDWILHSSKHGIFEYHTTGINAVRDSEDAMFSVLAEQLMPQLPPAAHITQIFFYGAGCIPPFSHKLQQCLARLFPQSHTEVESDLMGAARALCGNSPGIACILGTGSNSCLYDGKRITANVSPLGFILGDEGSGAVLGRHLLGLLLKGMLPTSLKEAFLDQYSLTPTDIIEKVYRQPQPNRFLASLVPFIHSHRHTEGIHRLLTEQFTLFLTRNVAHYGHPEMPINFTGSIAKIFREELQETIHAQGLKTGRIIQKPIQELTAFHTMQSPIGE